MICSGLKIGSFKAICGAFLLMLILCIPCYAAPGWTTWNNSKDNSTVYPHLNHSESITFNVTANEAITQYYWYKDNTLISNNWDNYTTSFTTPFTHNISVIGHGAAGNTSMLSWYPVVAREVATSTPETMDETGYEDMLDAVESESFESFVGASIFPYTNLMASTFYLVVFGLYFIMVWLRQDGMSNVIVVGFGVGAILLGFMVESFAQTLIMLLVIGVTAIFYSLVKERSS